MSAERSIEGLAQTALFGNVAVDVLANLASRSVEHKLGRGQILFEMGEPARGLYIVLSGAVRAFRVNPDGREQTIHVERAGGMLAEVALFDGGPYPSTTVAEEDSRVLFAAKEDVLQFMQQHPKAALNALAMMAKKLRAVASMVEQLALMDVNQRLAGLLLDEARKTTPQLKDGASFSFPLSHGQIAARLGSIREVVIRHLQKLTQLGIIEVRGHRVTVLSAKALLAQAGDRYR